MDNYELLKERLREAPSTEWSSGMLCAAADAIENLEKQIALLLERESALFARLKTGAKEWGDADEMGYRAAMGALNDMEEIIGLPRTENI